MSPGEDAGPEAGEWSGGAVDLFRLFLDTVPTARDVWSLPWDEVARRERAARQIAERMNNHLGDH
ncbi:hypothetical protein ACRYCC_27855 [Actinomadura scrupuli]|uniref:hypothetical protein n=1 Tax=Actinomadura scrupuli TaxID=559629 RepID=UPI003D97BF63